MIVLPPPPAIELPRPAIIRPASRDLLVPNQAVAFAPGFRSTPGAAAATLQFLQLSPNSLGGDTNPDTLANVPVGPAAADRYVFLAIPYYSGGTNKNSSITAVTIGGVAATIHGQANWTTEGTGYPGGVALASALVPTGTTANVVVTFTGGAGVWRPWLGVYRVTGLLSAVPVGGTYSKQTTSGSAVVPSWTCPVKKDGIIIAAAHAYGNTNPRTISGVTQNYHQWQPNSLPGANYLGGSSTVTADATATITVSSTTSSYFAAAIGAFR